MTDLKYTDLQSLSLHSIGESIQSSINERRRMNQEGDLANIIRYINDTNNSLSNRNVEWQRKSDIEKIKVVASAIMKPLERFIDLNQQR